MAWKRIRFRGGKPSGRVPISPQHYSPKAWELDDKAQELATEALKQENPQMWADAKAVKKVANAYRKLGQ